ncbi:LLM class flavin-dependent oxidoreductase [Streptomyces triticagri]|uniref:LLM class flavin-dependent oxidoreductase n=1 Tax=Streptomyces triticagri TaxID=2293568 RepID=A0A372M712_9ACTN|nr:LLM class flavin-dependent oxidoreductase [Streptomyces triticagri]
MLIRFGVHSGQQYRSFSEGLELWQRAEELGYDWVSLFDHYRPQLGGPQGPCFDGPTLLSALAARTDSIRCAMLVSTMTWRHPALAAAMAATIDHVSDGRLEFGLGAGGFDFGYEQYGIDFPAPQDRLDMLEESCHVMRSLWTEECTTFDGKHFTLRDARLEPKPVQPHLPLVIGGGGEKRMLGIVAKHADVWNMLVTDEGVYRRKLDIIARHCSENGRDPGEIRPSITFRAVLAETEWEAERRRRERLQILPPDSPDLSEYLTFGTPDQCVADLLPYLRLGVRDFLIGFRPPVDWRTMELFAGHVAPALRAADSAEVPR